MDHKPWLWRKKSTEKTIDSSGRASSPLKARPEQVEANGRVEMEKDFKDLNDKLSSAISMADNKDDIVKKHEKIAQEAIAARDKAETELVSLKKKLDESLKQTAADGERLARLELALEDCTQQLQFVREEQEHRIHDAVMKKVSREFEKSRVVLEDRLEETTKRLAKIVLENSHLSKSLLLKERSIEDLSKQRAQVESEFSAVINRLDAMERDNASLKYEVRVLEKELDIRNEEREFNRRSAEVSHKQHLESAKKAAKLESECQRLRLLVRKQLPTKTRSKAEVLGRDPSTKRMGALTEQVTSMEEENRALREALDRKSSELQVSRNMYSRAASKLSQVGPVRNVNNLYHVPSSLASISDMESDDKVSCAESWASALISELENFRNEKLKESPTSIRTRASEIDLMDDFVEMERIALSSADEPSKGRLSNFSCRMEAGLSPCAREDSRERLNKSVSKIVELLEGISFPSSPKSKDDQNFSSSKTSETPTGYTVRVFQWKTSELRNILQAFLHTCHELLCGKTDFFKFGQELALALEWILNHCFSLQDVSSMRDELVKSFDWDDIDNEAEAASVSRLVETVASTNGETKEDEASNKEPRRSVEILRNEIESLKESKRVIEDQIESHRSTNEVLDRQLSATRAELNEARKRSSSLEVELENKNSCCEELENTCLDLQLQLESVTQNKTPKDEPCREDTALRTDLDITAASEKLAECQETILNLGNQLKALASPAEAALFDKVVPATTKDSDSPKKSMSHRPSLLDQMLAEDNAKKANDDEKKVTYDNPEFVPDKPVVLPNKFQGSDEFESRGEEDGNIEALAIVPLKKQGGGGLWRKLLRKKKRVSSKKVSLPHAL